MGEWEKRPEGATASCIQCSGNPLEEGVLVEGARSVLRRKERGERWCGSACVCVCVCVCVGRKGEGDRRQVCALSLSRAA